MRALWLGLLLVGCGGDVDAKDSGIASTTVCDEVEGAVTWDNFGAGFTAQYCQGCHGSEVPEDQRNGAPEDVTFDDEVQVRDRAVRVLQLAASEQPAMPPLGGVPDDDRLLLEIWLSCY